MSQLRECKFNKRVLPLYVVMTFALIANTLGQVGFKDKCELLNSFINSQEVTSWLKEPVSSIDTIYYFLDPQNIYSSCSIKTWRGYSVHFINSGPLIDSLKKYDFHFIVKRRSNYYQIRESIKAGGNILVFHRGYDNLSSNVRVKKKKNLYYLNEVQSGVF